MPQGLLTIDPNTNVSTLRENTGVTRRLARSGGANIFGDATDFLVNQRNLFSGQSISVTSAAGTNASVIFVFDAGPLDQNAALVGRRAAPKSPSGGSKTGKKAPQAKKAAKKSASKSSKKASKHK